MEPNQINGQSQSVSQARSKTSAKDFVLNLGAIVALYTVIYNLISLLFTVINKAYPQITNGYAYASSYSISFPVATLIIFFPIFVLLMWLMEKSFVTAPEKKHLGVRKWLTYITLFIAGLILAGDLVTVLYYFIDGQELTIGFLLKIFVVLILAGLVFWYYISDIREKLNSKSRMVWLGVSSLLILASIVWGFSVLGSPRTQQLLKYDEQKVSDLQNINQNVISYFEMKGSLPSTLTDISYCSVQIYNSNSVQPCIDQQTKLPYEYILVGQSAKAYQLCADFNKASDANQQYSYTYPVQTGTSWSHPAGHYCFNEVISVNNQNLPPKGVPVY